MTKERMSKSPMGKNSLKKLFDAVAPMGPELAEKFVRDLLVAGDQRRRDAEKVIGEVVTASRKSAEQFGESVQREVAKQLTKVVKRMDNLEKQIENLNRNIEATRTMLVAAAAKTVTKSKQGTAVPAEKKSASTKKPATKKTVQKKPVTKKPAAKKTVAKKTVAKKTAAVVQPDISSV